MTLLNKKITLTLFLCVATLFVIGFLSDKALTVNEFEIKSDRIPSAFDGFRIAQLSDFHNATFGKDNSKLLELLESTDPDIIVVTGDIIDSRKTDVAVAEKFIEQAVKIAPVYYVTGNHESRTAIAFEKLSVSMERLGVRILKNEKIEITSDGQSIILCGINDPSFTADYLLEDEAAVMEVALEKLDNNDAFTVLLSHRPEFFELYAEHRFDVVLSGHAHGGQFRLPLIGGLIAPGQGLFPEYDSGLYHKNNTSMIVSRGIGNSIIPMRFNNRPEIIVAVLKEA